MSDANLLAPAPAERAQSAAVLTFYTNVEHRLHYACRVVRKARAAGLSVLTFAPDTEHLVRFDAALWTFSALEFLPHVYADSPLAPQTPILLAANAGRAPARDLLLYLGDQIPADFAALFARFARVVEVVSRDEDDRACGRARFKAYRDAGLTPVVHDAGTE